MGAGSQYLAYLGISFVLVAVVGTMLFRHGAVFLGDVFAGEPQLATAVNRLLLVGFYLINIGFVLLTASIATGDDLDLSHWLQTLTTKVGALAMILGVVHLINLSALNTARRRRVLERRRMAQA